MQRENWGEYERNKKNVFYVVEKIRMANVRLHFNYNPSILCTFSICLYHIRIPPKTRVQAPQKEIPSQDLLVAASLPPITTFNIMHIQQLIYSDSYPPSQGLIYFVAPHQKTRKKNPKNVFGVLEGGRV